MTVVTAMPRRVQRKPSSENSPCEDEGGSTQVWVRTRTTQQSGRNWLYQPGATYTKEVVPGNVGAARVLGKVTRGNILEASVGEGINHLQPRITHNK